MSFRDRPILEMKVPLTWTAGVAVIIAIVIGIALLLGDRRETLKGQAYGVTKNLVDTASGPVNKVVATPGRWTGDALGSIKDYIIAGTQNRMLRQQVSDLQRWHDQAIALQNDNSRLRAVLGLKMDPPIPMVTAHVISDSRGPFADTRLADVGAERGVAVGNPVMSERGLVGRVVGVGHGVSRILLLTDVVSRTPILVDRTDARAILTGDGGPNPKLSYMRGQNPVKEGDRILTSGDGGVFPRGLPVGVAVKGLDGSWRVRLDSDSAPIDYVRVLQFSDFSQLADEKAMAAPLPPLAPKDAAQVAALAAAANSSKALPPPAAGGKAVQTPAKPVAQFPVKAKPAAAPTAASPAAAGADNP